MESFVDHLQERFGLNWPGKAAHLSAIEQPSKFTFVECPEDSLNFKTTQNLFFEGDNFEVLKLLQESHAETVKLIYIDPPYNTGQNFIYSDNFSLSQRNQPKRKDPKAISTIAFKKKLELAASLHSPWLNMIFPRLLLAKKLLAPDGAIICHIDEHEVAHLTLIMNEIFGEDNNLGTLIWNKGNPKGDARGVSIQHEYLLVYANNKESFCQKNPLLRKKANAEKILRKTAALMQKRGKLDYPRDLEKIIKKYSLQPTSLSHLTAEVNLEQINQEFREWLRQQDGFSGGELAYNQIDERGDVFQAVSMAWPNKKNAPADYYQALEHPITLKACPVPPRGWRFPSATMKEMLNNNEVIFGKDETVQPRRKYLLKDNLEENLPSVLNYAGSDDKMFKQWGLFFENPKPLEFVKQILQVFVQSEDIVLDFFAGSGTTAHAVLEINQELHLHAKFIYIQIPEPLNKILPDLNQGCATIADIAKTRLKRAIEKIKTEQNMEVAPVPGNPVLDLGFKVMKLTPV